MTDVNGMWPIGSRTVTSNHSQGDPTAEKSDLGLPSAQDDRSLTLNRNITVEIHSKKLKE